MRPSTGGLDNAAGSTLGAQHSGSHVNVYESTCPTTDHVSVADLDPAIAASGDRRGGAGSGTGPILGPILGPY